MGLVRNQWHRHIYVFGLIVMAIGLPSSEVITSIGGIMLSVNWLLEFDFINKWQKIKHNKALIVLVSIWLLHIIGLLWTNDFNYAFKDIKIKLPLLFLPIVIGTSDALDRKQYKAILLTFSISVVICSIMSTIYYFTQHPLDTRDASLFVSHIRFSLMIVLSIFIFFKYATQSGTPIWLKISFLLIAHFLILFLAKSQWFTGFIILQFTLVILLIFLYLKINIKWLRISLPIIFIGGFILTIGFLSYQIHQYQYPKKSLESMSTHSLNGEKYIPIGESKIIENGNYVYGEYAQNELRNEWNKVSDHKIQKKPDNKCIVWRLIRYMNSKGLSKDSLGMTQLSQKDIEFVEKGFANNVYAESYGVKIRLYKILWEYNLYERKSNPSGHSLTQRIEFLKTAVSIIKKHSLIGVGTGDTPDVFRDTYEKNNSMLTIKWRLRSHNQYITFWITFGFFGFLWFLFSLIYPPLKQKKFNNFLFCIFFTIITISMFTEDTLETQTGATFFAYFMSFFLFASPEEGRID